MIFFSESKIFFFKKTIIFFGKSEFYGDKKWLLRNIFLKNPRGWLG